MCIVYWALTHPFHACMPKTTQEKPCPHTQPQAFLTFFLSLCRLHCIADTFFQIHNFKSEAFLSALQVLLAFLYTYPSSRLCLGALMINPITRGKPKFVCESKKVWRIWLPMGVWAAGDWQFIFICLLAILSALTRESLQRATDAIYAKEWQEQTLVI